MDSAVRLPVLGPVGLDALISMVPVVGDLAAGALSLTLVARSLRYGPPAALVSKMLANVLTDLLLGAIPVRRGAGRHLVQGERAQRRPDAGVPAAADGRSVIACLSRC